MFITFEGIDSCGKTTQIRRLAEWLEMDRIRYLLVREPGGTIISEEIRTLLLDARNHEMTAATEMLLFSAARAQLVREKIIPALRADIIVIADRFFDSTTAYQGYGRGIDLDAITQINNLATDRLAPDITFFLDITVQESLGRRKLANSSEDRIEKADVEFFERVRQGYHWIAKSQETRIVVIKGNRSEEWIAKEIEDFVRERLLKKKRKD